MSNNVTINQEAMDELLAVRDFGATNMFDRSAVIDIAENVLELEGHLALWSQENPGAWGSLILGSITVA